MSETSFSRRSFLGLLASVPVWITLPSGLVVAAQFRVRALRHWPEPEKTRLVLDIDGEAVFETRLERDPLRLIVDLPNAELATSLDQSIRNDPLVERVRTRAHGDGIVVEIDLQRECEVNAFPLAPNDAGKGHRIVLDVAPKLSVTETRAREARIAEVRDSGDKIIAIDPGHGGEDPGTVWGRSLQEKEIALEVSQRLATLIAKENGLRAVMTRESDYFVPLQQRQQIAKKYGADLFISIHVNAARSRSARGAEVFFLSLQGAEDRAARELIDRENAADLVGGVAQDRVNEPIVDILMGMKRDRTMQDSQRLAAALLRQLGEVPGAMLRGVKQGPLAVLKRIDKPSVLVELGFFTNSGDRKLLADPRAHGHYAQRLAHGIRDFLA